MHATIQSKYFQNQKSSPATATTTTASFLLASTQHFGHTFSLFIAVLVVVVAFDIYDFFGYWQQIAKASSLFWHCKLLNFNSKIMHIGTDFNELLQ